MENLYISKDPFWISVFVIAFIWSITWRAMALWRAAQSRDKGWFIVFMLVHTVGILEIIYLYFVRPVKKK